MILISARLILIRYSPHTAGGYYGDPIIPVNAVAAVVADPPSVKPFVIEPPLTARLEFESKAIADAENIPERYRIDEVTFEANITSVDDLMPRYWE